jgi:hypothetical protein
MVPIAGRAETLVLATKGEMISIPNDRGVMAMVPEPSRSGG